MIGDQREKSVKSPQTSYLVFVSKYQCSVRKCIVLSLRMMTSTKVAGNLVTSLEGSTEGRILRKWKKRSLEVSYRFKLLLFQVHNHVKQNTSAVLQRPWNVSSPPPVATDASQ